MLKNAQMSMQGIAGFLLSGDNVTEVTAENGPSEEMISVTESAPEIPVKRKRGRPPKAGGAMTDAERARRYRRRRSGMWGMRHVDLWTDTVTKLEKLAADTGYRLEAVVDFALAGVSEDYWNDLRAARDRRPSKFELHFIDA